MGLQEKEQKIFRRSHHSVEICGRCGGEGQILVWPEGDLWKQDEPTLEICPLCEGTGLLHKTVTITTELAPFKRSY